MGMEIDRLDIAIEAQASGAARELTTLYEQLNKVSSALGGSASAYRSSAREIGRVAAAVRSLSAIRMPDFSKTINQLQALARINLNNLSSKKIKIDVELGGAAGTNFVKNAIEDTLEKSSFDTSAISDRLLKAFNIDGRAASKQIRSTVQQIATELTRSFDGNKIGLSDASEALFDALIEDIWENGKLIDDGLDNIEKEYADFLDHMRRNPMKVSSRDVGKSEFAEMRGELLRYFNSQNGVSTDNGFFKELQDRFKNIFPQEDVANVADQVSLIIEKIKEARSVTEGKPLINLTGEDAEAARNAIWDAVGAAGEEMRGAITNNIQEAMKSLDGKLMLDVEINEDKIQRDIRNAINRASQVKYDPIKLTLDIDNKNVKNAVKESVANMDAGTVPEIANAYESIVHSMQNLKTVAGNKEIEKIVGSMQKLAKTDMSKFDSQSFTVIADTFERIAKIPDVSATVNRLVSTITRLAKSGDQMRAATAELPAFASGLEQAMKAIGASGGATGDTAATLEAFTKIATAGDKISVSAAGIPAATSAIVNFLNAMSTAPEASESTQSLVASFAAIATAGKRVGNVGDQVSRAYNSMANSGARSAAASRVAAGAFTALKTALSGLEKAAKTALTAMEKIAKACLNVGTAVFNPIGTLKKFGSSIQAVGNRIGLTTPKIDRATFSFRNLLRAIVPFYGIRSIFNWGKEATELASDLTEVQNVVENSFGTKGTEMVENFADSAIENFGMTELTAKQIASRYQAMGNAMGITTGQIAKANENMADRMIDSYKEVGDGMGNMSVRLTMLAADMASFYNVEQETVAEALNAVYTGQTRPLRQYGIDLTQATLQEWANKQGIDAKISSMSQAEKTMLRYQYVIASTSTIQGDFARTSMTWANQVRMLRQNLQALAAVVGNTLVNAFRPLVVWLNTAMSSVISFAETVGNALGKIFGWQIMHTPASNAADVYDTLAESLGDTETAGDGAADGLGKAAKAAEEYKNTVLGFDELNKLNGIDVSSGSPSSGGGSGGGSGSPGAGVVDGTGADFQLVRADSWFEEYKSDIDSLEELGEYVAKTLKKAMERIKWDEIYEKARGFGTGLADFLNGLFKDPTVFGTLGSTIASAINTVLNAKDAFLDRFNFTNLGKSIASAINGFFNTYDFDLKAKNFYKLINGIIKAIKAAADDIEWKGIGTKISGCVKQALQGINWKDAYDAASSFGSGLASFLNGLIDPETFNEIGRTVGSALNTALQFLNNFGTIFEWDEFGTSIAEAIKGFFEEWDPELTAETFNTFALGLLTSIKSAIEGVSWEQVGAKISQMLKGIDWALLLKTVGDAIMTGINAALDLAKGLFDGTPVEKVITNLKETINGIAELIDFPAISEGFQSIADACVSFGSGFAIGLTDAFGALAKIGVATLGAIGNVFQKIADALNSLPEGTLEKFGEGLGKIAGYFLVIKGAKGVAGIISSVVGSLTGLGAAGETASAAIGGLATGTATTGAVTMFGKLKYATKTFLDQLVGFAQNGGATVMFQDAINRILIPGLTGASEEARNTSEDFGALAEAMGDAGVNGTTYFSVGMEGIMANMDTLSTEMPTFEEGFEHIAEKVKVSGDNVDDFNGSLDNLLESGKLGADAAETVRKYLEDIGYSAEESSSKATNLQGKLNDAVIGMLKSTSELSSTATIDFNTLNEAVKAMGDQFDLDRDSVMQLQDILVQQQSSGAPAIEAYNSIKDALGNMTGNADDAARALDEQLNGALKGSGNGAKDADGKIGTMKTNIWKFAAGMGAQTLLLGLLSLTFDAFGTSAEGADTKIGTMASNGASSLKTLGEDAKTAGNDFVNGFITPIESSEERMATAIDTLSKTEMLDRLRTNLDSHSPSKEAESIGTDFTQGLINGIESLLETLGATMSSVTDAITGAFEGFDETMNGIGSSLMTSFDGGLASMNDTISTTVGTIATTVTSGLSVSDDMYTAGWNITNSFSNGMNAGLRLPRIDTSWTRYTYGNGGWFDLPSFSLSWFAKGGFPNLGELFIANEKGPELVGKMGNRTTVANNMQITEGIREAVVDGMMEVAMATFNGNGSDEVPYVINLRMVTDDDETLARRVERGRMKRDARYSPSPTYA